MVFVVLFMVFGLFVRWNIGVFILERASILADHRPFKDAQCEDFIARCF
jgi:predicted permease